MDEGKILRKAALGLAVDFVTASLPIVGEVTAGRTMEIAEAFLAFLKGEDTPKPAQRPIPAVPVEESIQPEYLVCLDDGFRAMMLKRHIEKLGYTPASYRLHWGLPSDYPLVAPAYSARRSEIAKTMKLGFRWGAE